LCLSTHSLWRGAQAHDDDDHNMIMKFTAKSYQRLREAHKYKPHDNNNVETEGCKEKGLL